MTITDSHLQTLWEGCVTGNRKCQDQLYKLLAPRMLQVCMRYFKDQDEARDILQEGFIKTFRNMKGYRGDGSLEGWIRRIMTYTAISRYRKLKPVVLCEDMATHDSISISRSFNNNALDVEDLIKLVNTLPDNYHSVFKMYAIEGYSHYEIGSHLGITELLSRTLLHRARGILKSGITNNMLRPSYHA
jgi:RNA polymerase sigma factor (sigma-70 family)